MYYYKISWCMFFLLTKVHMEFSNTQQNIFKYHSICMVFKGSSKNTLVIHCQKNVILPCLSLFWPAVLCAVVICRWLAAPTAPSTPLKGPSARIISPSSRRELTALRRECPSSGTSVWWETLFCFMCSYGLLQIQIKREFAVQNHGAYLFWFIAAKMCI